MISETKLNDSFPGTQLVINGFHPPYRKDRTAKGGGLIIYIHNNIPRTIDIKLHPLIEAFVVEINLKKEKVASYLLLQSTEIYDR